MITCAWIFRPALPAARVIRRHIIGPAIRRARPRLRHAAVWVCSAGATLVPLPGPLQILPPAGVTAPIYGEGYDLTPGLGGVGFGALTGPGAIPAPFLARLPPPGPLLDVPGLLVSGEAPGDAVTAVPEPASVVVFVTCLVSLAMIRRAFV
jgi:hypothetical protein